MGVSHESILGPLFSQKLRIYYYQKTLSKQRLMQWYMCTDKKGHSLGNKFILVSSNLSITHLISSKGMKYLLVIACLLFLQDSIYSLRLKRESPDRASKVCIMELNLEAEKIMKINGFEYTPEDNDDYIKYTECYWKRMGNINDNGDFNYDNLKKVIIDSIKEDIQTTKSLHKIADLILEQCNVEASTVGLKAVRMENCIMKYYKIFLNKYSVLKTSLSN